MATNTQKLRVLRSRTDHDLLVMVQRELDRGLALVNVASVNSVPFAQARRAHEEAAALLPKITGLELAEREQLEVRLAELRSRLEQIPKSANTRSYPASLAS